MDKKRCFVCGEELDAALDELRHYRAVKSGTLFSREAHKGCHAEYLSKVSGVIASDIPPPSNQHTPADQFSAKAQAQAQALVDQLLTAAAKFLDLTLAAILGTDVRTESLLYFSLTTAQGAAATADIYIYGDVLA